MLRLLINARTTAQKLMFARLTRSLIRSPSSIINEANRNGEPKVGQADTPVDHEQKGNEVKSSSLSESSASSNSGSRRTRPIEHERQVEGKPGSFSKYELGSCVAPMVKEESNLNSTLLADSCASNYMSADDHKTTANKTGDARASKRGRKSMINEDYAAREGKHRSKRDTPIDDEDKHDNRQSSTEQSQAKNISSSPKVQNRTAGTSGSSSSSKKLDGDTLTEENDQRNVDHNNNRRDSSCTSESADFSLAKQSQVMNLVKSGSKRSSRHKLTTKSSEESAEGKTCNSGRNGKSRAEEYRKEECETEQCNPVVACDNEENTTDVNLRESVASQSVASQSVASPLQRPKSSVPPVPMQGK